MQDIHISDVRTFRTCRRKWDFSSPLRKNLEPIATYGPFILGRAVHHCLEMFYGPQHTALQDSLDEFMDHELDVMKAGGRLWPQEKQELDEQTELASILLQHYELWYKAYKGSFNDHDLEFVLLEHDFTAPLHSASGRRSGKFQLAGRFDGVVKHIPTDTYWIWETKTTRSIGELSSSLVNDEQAGAYLYAAQTYLGVEIVGVLYNVIRKKEPASPEPTKQGVLSRRKDIDTTAAWYYKTARAYHSDWDHEQVLDYYSDILSQIIFNGKQFFARIPIKRTQFEIKTLADHLYATALEMTRPQTVMYPAPSWLTCKMCSFRGPCLAMNSGNNVELMLQEEYQTRAASISMRTTEESNGQND